MQICRLFGRLFYVAVVYGDRDYFSNEHTNCIKIVTVIARHVDDGRL